MMNYLRSGDILLFYKNTILKNTRKLKNQYSGRAAL